MPEVKRVLGGGRMLGRGRLLSQDPEIEWRAALSARLLQAAFPAVLRLRFSSPRLRFATRAIAPPSRIMVPTRHGAVRALVYSPIPVAGVRPPVHLIAHGGAFIIRAPRQEDNVACHLASEVGCFVVVPDYDTAPAVRFPVAEHQVYDTFRWIQRNGPARGWDGERVSVGGASAGGKLALNVVQQSIEDGAPLPVAVSAEYAAADLSRYERPSPLARPMISARLIDLVRRTYFAGTDPTDPLASPLHYRRLSEFPPTLVLTGGHDTLRHEMTEFAAALAAAGVNVLHREFPDADHGFTHTEPADVAHEAITLLPDLLRKAYT